MVRHHHGGGSVLISSFEPGILARVSAMDEAPAVALITRSPGEADDLARCLGVNAFSWHPNCTGLTRDHVRAMHEAGIMVFPYNVDDARDYERVTAMDVDGVISSDPAMALELRAASGGGGG